ncbi:MAG: hypothetical protein ACT4NL_13175, partial [Pseudomarimonas sp.]
MSTQQQLPVEAAGAPLRTPANRSAQPAIGSRSSLRQAALALGLGLVCVFLASLQPATTYAAAAPPAQPAGLSNAIFASGFETSDIAVACQFTEGRDRDGDGLIDPGCVMATSSPDPATTATPIDPTIPVDFGTAIEFIYNHATPVQHGMLPNVIQPYRVAVLRGEIRDENGAPLAGVMVRVLDHPEVGVTFTRADGMFDIVVNGGAEVVLDYRKPGYLPAQRSVVAPWRDWEWVPDATLVPIDPVVTRIVTAGQMPRQLIRSSIVTDAAGIREAVLLVPPAITAELRMHDGSSRVMTELNVRATEYTVGERGSDRMPAPLPPTSAYTYAVDFSADEARAANARSVEFNQPLAFYLDNFLNAPVGTAIPVGYLDARLASWLPSDNGRVIQILAVTNGVAVLDIDGSGQPASVEELAALGIDLGERTQLATLYPAGKELWRTPIAHFTEWDCNFPYAPNADDEPPQDGTDDDEDDCDGDCNEGEGDDDPNDADVDENVEEEPDCVSSSLIRCQPASLQESIPVAGTGQSLVYHSERVPRIASDQGARLLTIKITRDTVPARLTRATLEVISLGRRYESEFTSLTPNLRAHVRLEAVDAYGRSWNGLRPWAATLSYHYPLIYTGADRDLFARTWAMFYANRVEDPFARFVGFERVIARRWESRTKNITPRLAPADWDATGLGYGGWSLSGHHVLDREAWKLYLGDGNVQRVALPGSRGLPIAQTLIKRYGPSDLQFGSRFAFAADGTLWTLARRDGEGQEGDNTVWKYGFDGTRRLGIDPCPNGGTPCDPQPNGSEDISNPGDITVDPRGFAFVTSHSRIFQIAANGAATLRFDGDALDQACQPGRVQAWADRVFFSCGARVFALWRDGQVTHLAGGGTQSGDDISPQDFEFVELADLTVDTNGQLYVLDSGASVIYRIRQDGVVERAVGTGSSGVATDGSLAVDAPLGSVTAMSILPNGNLIYATGNGDFRLRELRGNGRLYTLAGGGEVPIADLSGQQSLSGPLQFEVDDVGVLPDGSIAFMQTVLTSIDKVTFTSPTVVGVIASSFSTAHGGYSGETADTLRITSRDGSRRYVFDAQGRHQATRDVVTGAVLMAFGYNSSGYVTSVTDGDGNRLTIERDANHRATALVAHDGQRTVLGFDAAGRLNAVTDPLTRRWRLNYLLTSGLLTRFENPRGFASTFEWDVSRLAVDSNAESGEWRLLRYRYASRDANATAMQTAEGRANTYFVNNSPSGEQLRSVRHMSGTTTIDRADRVGKTQTTRSDGVVIDTTLSGDPRFGWDSPFVSETVVSVPQPDAGGALLQRQIINTRNASAPIGAPPEVGDFDLDFTTRVNGRPYRRTYDAPLRTWHLTTPQGRGISVRLDGQGRPLDVDVPDLAQVRYRYDSRGRLSSVEAGSGPDLRRFSLAYDPNGWPMTVVDAEQRSHVLQHDVIGRLTRQQTPDQRDIDFRFDPASNVVGLTPPGRDEHVFGYDKVDRMLSYAAPVASVGEGRQTTYTYSPDGQLTNVLRPDEQAVAMTYAGSTALLTSVQSPATGTRPLTIDGYGRLTVAALYSAQFDGFLQRQVFSELPTNLEPIDRSARFAYDTDFRVKTVSVVANVSGAPSPDDIPAGYTFDGDSLLASLTFAGRSQSFVHHPGNGLLQSSSVAAFNENWQYNAFAEPIAYTSSRSGAAQLDFGYTRDRLGRITQVTETRAGVSRATGYTYDLAGRLERITRN